MRIFLVLLMLSGCVDLNSIGTGSTGFILAPEPRRSGCASVACQELDNYEAWLYDQARDRRFGYWRVVRDFYAKRDKLFPNNRESESDRELHAYQRVLADQVDRGEITQAQWVYFIDKRIGELNARSAIIQNSRPRSTNCTTVNVGSAGNPMYSTHCN